MNKEQEAIRHELEALNEGKQARNAGGTTPTPPPRNTAAPARDSKAPLKSAYNSGETVTNIGGLDVVDVPKPSGASGETSSLPAPLADDRSPTARRYNFKSLKNAVDLRTWGKTEYPPTRWIIPDLLAEGLTLLAGDPKAGKSFFALDMALSVATGRQFWGLDTQQADILFLGLEDTLGSLQERADALGFDLGGLPASSIVSCDTTRADLGGLDDIRHWLTETPTAGLVVIDIWGKFKSPAKVGTDQYEETIQKLGELSALAYSRHCALMLVHHTNKRGGRSEDIFSDIHGSQGLRGSAYTNMVIVRKKNPDKEPAEEPARADLHIESKGAPGQRYKLINSKHGTKCIKWVPIDAQSLQVEEIERRKQKGTNARLVIEALEGGAKTGIELQSTTGLDRQTVNYVTSRLRKGDIIRKDGELFHIAGKDN